MKFLSLMLLAGSTLVACKKDNGLGGSSAGIGQPFKVAIQQTATVPIGSGGSLNITLTDVQDSRCPSGVQCIWAGYAAVTVQLTDATATPQTARLTILNNLPTYTRDSVSVTLNQQQYWLRLLDVTPYPGERNGSTKTTATLRLRPA